MENLLNKRFREALKIFFTDRLKNYSNKGNLMFPVIHFNKHGN